MTGESTNELMTHLTAGSMVVYGIEYLKKLPGFQKLTPDTKTANAVVSFVAAGIIAVGISATGDSSHGWTISVPPLAVMAAAFWDWIKQFVLQQLIFDGVVQKPKP